MNRDSVAKRVRLEKEAHPERFCPVAGCLWRTTIMGKLEPCRKHPGPVNLRPFVIASGTHVEFTVNAFLPLTTEIKERV